MENNTTKNHQDNRKRYSGKRSATSSEQSKSAVPAVPVKKAPVAKPKREPRRTPVRIIPLGGLNEIGKNMTVIECSNDMFIIDCGLAFPDTEMPGVDIVIPDFTYVEKNRDKLRGVVLTHGHEDHIGGLAYLLKKVNVPVYGTKLTLGLVEGKLKEHGLYGKANLNVVSHRKTVRMGCMAVEFIRVNHSIPDAVGMAVHTPAGIIVHTGDFKIDYSPINGEIIDLTRFGELGSKGVLALMADSTNAERPGYTQSERKVGESFEKLFTKAEGKRIIIATFSSNIHRIQQIVNCAEKYGRKVAVFGRSMINVISTAIELGYLDVPKGIIIDIDMMNRYDSSEIILITTGSQGEPMSALTRMASNDHKSVQIRKDDIIVLSSSPIPGNEKTISNVVNKLLQKGAQVIYSDIADIHVSGHPCQEELKLMHSLIRPKYFMPIHGEYRHLDAHAKLAQSMGTPKENIFILRNGNVLTVSKSRADVAKEEVTSGQVLVDGLGVGDVGNIVLRDRKLLSESGLIVVVAAIEKGSGLLVSGPEIISRGFVYVRESEELITSAREVVTEVLESCQDRGLKEWSAMKNAVRDELRTFIYEQTKRSPIILPIFLEV